MDNTKLEIIKKVAEDTGRTIDDITQIIYDYENCVPYAISREDFYRKIIMYRFGTFYLKKRYYEV